MTTKFQLLGNLNTKPKQTCRSQIVLQLLDYFIHYVHKNLPQLASGKVFSGSFTVSNFRSYLSKEEYFTCYKISYPKQLCRY